jgi:sulfur-oxidizing protein SoxZ
MSVRALVSVPKTVARGAVIDVRTTLQHPMETGFRADAVGRTIPRDIVRRFEAFFVDELVFAADLHPAVAANPYIAFSLKVTRAGDLRLVWRGDNGLVHTESARIALA